MSVSRDEQRDQLLLTVRAQKAATELEVRRLQNSNSRHVYVSIVSGSLATLVSGLTAAFGKSFADALGGWRLTCAVAAGLTLLATIASGLHKAFTVPERLARATACLGRLKALELALAVRDAEPLEVAADYEELLAANADLLA